VSTAQLDSPVRVVEVPTPTAARCRCGRALPPGGVSVTFDAPADPIGYLLRGQYFCGLPCARAYLLETSEVLDAAAATGAVSDFESVYAVVHALLAVVDRERSLRRLA
jgi:hypothetical protein